MSKGRGRLGYPRALERAWATHEGLRKLGFTSDEIFVIPDGGYLFVQLVTQGKTMNIRVDKLHGLNPKQLQSAWIEMAGKINSHQISDEDLWFVYEAWLAHLQHLGGAGAFVMAIYDHGIVLPRSKSEDENWDGFATGILGGNTRGSA